MTNQQQAQLAARQNVSVEGKACEECGATGKLHRHHDDYSKPLEVVILCPACHRRRHAQDPQRRYDYLSIRQQERFRQLSISGATAFKLSEEFDLTYETARRNRELIRDGARDALKEEK